VNGYWRWRFVKDSRGLSRLDGVPHTVFQAVARGKSMDLRAEPFVRDHRMWGNPEDYSACQALARAARTAETQIIRYASVRDPEHGDCGAVLGDALRSAPRAELRLPLQAPHDERSHLGRV